MNNTLEIKELLNKYFAGESSDADEQRLREYFASEEVSDELQPYRSIFACLSREREMPKAVEYPVIPINRHHSKIWYAAAGMAAALLFAGIFLPKQQPDFVQTGCNSGTYVIVNGVCYDDLQMVSKYAVETIDEVCNPAGFSKAAEVLDFLDEL
jgi:hypothetical protein